MKEAKDLIPQITELIDRRGLRYIDDGIAMIQNIKEELPLSGIIINIKTSNIYIGDESININAYPKLNEAIYKSIDSPVNDVDYYYDNLSNYIDDILRK